MFRSGEGQIYDLLVECDKQGCSWTGTLRDKHDHMTKSCDLVMVNCNHDGIGCTQKATKKLIREHEEDDNIHLPLLLEAVKIIRGHENVVNDDRNVIKVEKYQIPNVQATKFNSQMSTILFSPIWI